MKKLNLVLINAGYLLISMIIYLLLITILAHFNLITYKTVSIISFVFINLLFLFNGFKTGRRSERKGYLSGLIVGLISVLIMIFIGIIFSSPFSLKSLIYFAILILDSIVGGMLGINFKK